MSSMDVFTQPQPIELLNETKINLRRLNRTVSLVGTLVKPIVFEQIDDITVIRNQLILDEIFLNYKFALNRFRTYFNVTTFTFTNDLVFELVNNLVIKGDYKNFLSIFLQFIYMSLSDKLNKHPRALSALIVSRLLSLYNVSTHVKKFIDDCDRQSLPHCSLVVTYQNEPFISYNFRQVESLFQSIRCFNLIEYGDDRYSFVFLTDSAELICVEWIVQFKSSKTRVAKLMPSSSEYKLLRTFRKKRGEKKEFAFIVASDQCAILVDQNKTRRLVENQTIRDVILIGDHSLVVIGNHRMLLYSLDQQQEKEDSFYGSLDFESNLKLAACNYDTNRCCPTDTKLKICLLLDANNQLIVLESLYESEHFESRAKLDPAFARLYTLRIDDAERINSIRMIPNRDQEVILVSDAKNGILSCDPRSSESISKDSSLTIQCSNDTFVCFKSQQSTTFIYNLKTKKTFKLITNPIYNNVICELIEKENFGILIFYTDLNVSVYIFKEKEKEVELISLIENLTFSNEIFHIDFDPKSKRFDFVLDFFSSSGF